MEYFGRRGTESEGEKREWMCREYHLSVQARNRLRSFGPEGTMKSLSWG